MRRSSFGLSNKIMAVLCRCSPDGGRALIDALTQSARLLDIARAARMLRANSLPARPAAGAISFL
jgi:hypothetical protein